MNLDTEFKLQTKSKLLLKLSYIIYKLKKKIFKKNPLIRDETRSRPLRAVVQYTIQRIWSN